MFGHLWSQVRAVLSRPVPATTIFSGWARAGGPAERSFVMAEVETQDVASVGSRVSWGAIFAGAFVALTLCVFLGLLGGALNLTAVDADVRDDQLAVGAGIWSILALLV